MPDLVFINPKGKDMEPYTTSDIVAEMTGNNYRSIQRIIETQKERLETFGIMRFQIALLGKRGRPKKVYHLNEPQATLLITFLKNTDLVADFKMELVRQFYAMREYIRERQSPIWKDTRALGKQIRKEESDAIKALVDYARGQGSQHAERYYISLSRLADVSAGITNRDTATVMQLNSLLMMERLIAKEIQAGINSGKPYADIYNACKERVSRFVAVTG